MDTFQVRTDSKKDDEGFLWTDHYPDAVFDEKERYVFFTITAKNAYDAVKEIRAKGSVSWCAISIWDSEKNPPWKKP